MPDKTVNTAVGYRQITGRVIFMSNIQAVNAEGVDELMIIGTALKNAKSIIEEQAGDNSSDLQIDKAIGIIDKVIDEGFASV